MSVSERIKRIAKPIVPRPLVRLYRSSRLLQTFVAFVARPHEFKQNWRNVRRFYLSGVIHGMKHPFQDEQLNGTEFRRRAYASYEEYLRHQKEKFGIMEETLKRAYSSRRENFAEQFRADLASRPGASILCLGARDGAEVDALRSLGLLAVGIDIEYPPDNEFVHYGDFHNIPYPESCFDFAYTNAFDHIHSPERLLAEIARILKPHGWFLLDIPTEGDGGHYESFAWSKPEDVERLLESRGWIVDRRAPRADRTNWRLLLRHSAGADHRAA